MALLHASLGPEKVDDDRGSGEAICTVIDMHGEYKVPGGKLVAADVQVVDGKLANVAISGDFFLEPDEALASINAILTGLSAETDAAALTSAVAAVTGPTVTMVGFSP